MPKLPLLKATQLINGLQRAGFYKHGQSGSHLRMRHSDGRMIIIPVHKGRDLRKGTLKAILRDAEITVEQLIKLIR